MDKSIEYLLNCEHYVRYRTKIDLLGESPDSDELTGLKKKMLEDKRIKSLLDDLEEGMSEVLNSHKSARHPIHKLSFLADLGFTLNDANISKIAEKIMANKSKEGLYQVIMNIPGHFGGSGMDEVSWALCDAPIILYSLAKFGVDYNYLKEGIDYIKRLVRDNGFPCKVSENLGKFRGPGKKDDSCPYVNLIMLKLFSITDKECKEIRIAAESLLNNWENSQKLHPYMFFMGDDFRKLKAPFVWYDILHVTDALSRFDYVRDDFRYKEMVEVIKSKQTGEGLFIPESVWQPWKEWDFGQKKAPSGWLTFLALRILKK